MTSRDHRRGGLPLVAGLLLSLAAPEALAASEQSWRPLFNGRDLSGWTVKCKPADRERAWWRVEDGAIVADSRGHIALQIHTGEELRVRFRGLQVRSVEQPDPAD
jgi:hypothetical protein